MTATVDWRLIAVSGIVFLIIYDTIKKDAANLLGAPGRIASKVAEGVTFRESSLGPKATLTPAARIKEREYIRLGYLERTPSGGTRITTKGEKYLGAFR